MKSTLNLPGADFVKPILILDFLETRITTVHFLKLNINCRKYEIIQTPFHDSLKLCLFECGEFLAERRRRMDVRSYKMPYCSIQT